MPVELLVIVVVLAAAAVLILALPDLRLSSERGVRGGRTQGGGDGGGQGRTRASALVFTMGTARAKGHCRAVSQGPRPGRGIEGLKCLVNALFSRYRPLSGIVIVLSDPIVIQIAKTFCKTQKKMKTKVMAT